MGAAMYTGFKRQRWTDNITASYHRKPLKYKLDAVGAEKYSKCTKKVEIGLIEQRSFVG